MGNLRSLAATALAVICLAASSVASATPPRIPQPVAKPQLAVGPQYDTTHVYVAPEDFDRFTDSFVATFGGHKSQQGVFQVTPTPSQTMSQLVFTPVGTISVFGFKTPVPYPFGNERTGYLVTDMDAAMKSAKAHGADIKVATFPDPIGRDAIIEWPGGVDMQLYWHNQAPNYVPLQTVPENRVYVSSKRADALIHDFVAFSHGKVVADDRKAPGVEIGRPGDTYRRVRIDSGFGRMTVLATDGHLPWPFGREMTGYEVTNLADTLQKAQAAGVTVLVPPFTSDKREAALVQFPGGYIAEIHAVAQ
ncbi:glyoxalase [Paraburkholderia panacisoli]|uniref:Glyoxalase n=1 Tax=Paraburkholderia panacisoli TaxID=2603818 RepID=A0A5B0G9D0_9BURK|nr:glyoxalase [Paraburkholderia panacisoli]KAA0999295.1 glyoxalase [Paraburkholderia panacisoli]